VKKILIALTAALMFSVAASGQAQRDFSDVMIKTTKVSGSVYMLEGSGGNIGFSTGTDGVLLIDCQYEGLADKIIPAIRKINDRGIKYIINTHYHGKSILLC